MNFVMATITCAVSMGTQPSEHSYEITDIRNIMGAWTVDADENIFIKFRTSYIDENGKISETNQEEITHVLYEGNISVQKPQEGSIGIVETWIDDTAILYTESTFVPRERMYRLNRYMKPGDGGRYGFVFTGFIGLDTNIVMSSSNYPSIAAHVYSVSENEDEVSIVVVPVGVTYEQSYDVYVIGTDDQRIRRVEWWANRPDEGGHTQLMTAKYSNWKSVHGIERPTTMFVSSRNSTAGTQYEIVEIRPATEDDIGVIPPGSAGATISDDRVRFGGWIGDTRFNIDGFQYKSTIPISGPPLNLEALLASSRYADYRAPRIAQPIIYQPDDKQLLIDLEGEIVTLDLGQYDKSTGERTLAVPIHFKNTSSDEMVITGWKISPSSVKVSPKEAILPPGDHIEVIVNVDLWSGGVNTTKIQPLLQEGDDASVVQLEYEVQSTYSIRILNSTVRLAENQKGTLKLICISPDRPTVEILTDTNKGIEGVFTGWVEVNPEDVSTECLGKLWQSTVEVTGLAVKDSWILIRNEKYSLGLFPVISDY